ncbi:Vacuolar morphoproteinsis protein 6 [Rhodotorula kratochvilovae]
MHAPFSLLPLIRPDVLGSEPVTASLLHADRIVLGTERGTLLVFDLSRASSSLGPPSATLVNRHDGFSKKPIEQLGVIKELNALVCLSGGDLTLHSFPDLAVLSTFASQTRGTASLFALCTEIHHPASSSAAPGIPEIHTTLALACKRRLLLLSWVDGTWNPQVEVSLPHQVRGMAFDSRRLVCGFSTGDYGVVTLPSLDEDGSKMHPVLGELFNLPLVLPERPSQSSVRGLGGFTTGLGNVVGLGALGALAKKLEKNGVVGVPRLSRKGKLPQRSASGVPDKQDDGKAWLWGKEWGWEDEEVTDGEVFVVRDNIALPLLSSGRPRPSLPSGNPAPSITYPSTVDETLIVPPYVVSLLSHPAASTSTSSASPSLSIHALDSLAHVQTLSVPPSTASPPVSLAASSLAALDKAAPAKPLTVARLLTVSSSTPKPPLLVLTATSAAAGAPMSTAGSLEQTLWVATMEPWQAQLEELGEQGRWEEGIRLLRGSFDVISESLPPPLSRRLAILHSLHLFETHRYALAIDAFIALDLNPARVVSLYPRAISGKLFLEHSAHEEVFGGRPQHKVAAALEAEEERRREEEERKKLEREQEAQAKGSPAASSPAKRAKGPLANAAAAEDDDAASIRSVGSRLGVKRSWLRERDTGATLDEIADQAAKEQERQAKADAQNRSRAVEELIRYLTDRRQKYSQAFAALLPSSRPSPASPRPPAPPSELFDLPNEPLTKLAPAQLARVAQVVDTALFRAYLATKPVMVGPLCRIENWGEVEEVEELLLDAKKYRELLDLYNGKNMHETAVELLKQMSEDEDDPEEKVGPTVRYLQKLGADHVEVIFEASKWVFEQDSTAGLQIFVADLEEVETLPRHAVMAHLEKVGRDVCIRYLEHIVHELGEQGADFHEKLVELYLAAVQAPPSGRDGTAYKKVLDLLESSTSYRPDRMLGRLPSEDMHEVRAILLGRLGRHEGALQIYVYQLEDHATAEQYCKRVYDSDEAMRPTIFHLLLRLYLRPRPNHPLLFTPALSLLSTQAARIDPIEAFDLLPPLVALGDIKVYLEKTLRKSNERAREAKMVKALGRSWLDQQERAVVDLEERRVKITEGRVCPVCHKRIGNSVIAIHNPHGVVTHYQCREQYQEERA